MRKLEGLRESDRFQSLASERRERLKYLAELLSELEVLAKREGCKKLSGLIALSRAEALEESLSGSLQHSAAFQRNEAMTLTPDATRKVKLENCDLDVLHAEASGASDCIDGHRRRSQSRQTAFIRSQGAMLPDGGWQLVWFDAVSTGSA